MKVVVASKGVLWTDEGATSRRGYLISSHALTNFEILKHYQDKPKFKSVYSSNNLPKINDGVDVINLDGNESIETHWIAWYVTGKFYTKYIQNISKSFNNVWTLLYWIYWFYAKNKSLLDYTNLFFHNKYQKI